jgi:hypothetical protein
MGICCHVKGAAIPRKGSFPFFYDKFMHALNIVICNVYVSNKRKILLLCRKKINLVWGIETCVYSWLNGLHGREQPVDWNIPIYPRFYGL